MTPAALELIGRATLIALEDFLFSLNQFIFEREPVLWIHLIGRKGGNLGKREFTFYDSSQKTLIVDGALGMNIAQNGSQRLTICFAKERGTPV